jgi:hypothetical protein
MKTKTLKIYLKVSIVICGAWLSWFGNFDSAFSFFIGCITGLLVMAVHVAKVDDLQ